MDGMISVRCTFAGSARLLIALLASLAFMIADMSAAMAQNQNCGQITAILRGIERNQMFQSFNGIARELQNRQVEVRQAENQWVASGCQQVLNAGQALSGQCQSIAQSITLGRSQVEQLTSMAQEGQTMAQNYQRVMADYQRYGCDTGQSGVTFGNEGTRGGLLNDIFGGGYDYVDGAFNPWSTQQTRRTVCVRTCDGFYWPISFSTTDDYVAQDAIRCHEMCPGTEVAMFSYRNPGEEPEDMISLSGTPYRSMPYAFRFREEIDTNCSCQTRETVGTIAVNGQGGQSRAIIDFGDLEFPLPQPDPRGTRQAEAVVADLIYVPLPRPRPRADGTADPQVQQPDLEGPDMRVVAFGNKDVRIVGPETPYVPEPEEAP
ncbi:DUF2865 domain-containing protein [Pelagibacterium halotolerans]|uniref:DUF2865 domain-containing protein n=1 Tax=Pelagibacterium halotolerans TaxID=531813 RepID=UPI000680B353|nr:DUF2865 domain-containing protein [Pelagibacterium halotolerans]QJR19177.1 DUF2865 domain-containing protein [Pelagibacterium halotolerans]SEA00028.1 Protein of unknown function [Pelagibacterium halotolerans]